ncbi:MAG: type VII secretion protein EssC [Gracilibacteraceae bacterium]|jgi:S-DNA-T family DNA segregation ATPase FtsK/SpoIIIE|nr:type VII secretion protein EssC [Gracilibacteraceae bacterium]
MNLALSIHFLQNYFEYFLPSENNRTLKVEIPSAVSGFVADILLPLEVWEGQWFLGADPEIGLSERIPLCGGLRLNCLTRRRGEYFVLIVEEVSAEYTAFAKYDLRRTPAVTVGREGDNHICFDTQQLVGRRHAALEVGSDGRYTVVDKSRNGTFVNGRRISGRQILNFGDIVGIFGLKIVYLGDIIAVNKPTPECVIKGLAPHAPAPPPAPPAAGADEAADGFYQRAPRLVDKTDDEEIEIEAPPGLNRSPRPPLFYLIGPAITMVIPMATAALFMMLVARQSGQTMGAFIYIGIVTSATAAIIGVFWALMNTRYQKRVEAEEAERRDTQYRQYLERMRRILEEKHITNKSVLERLYPPVLDCLRFTQPGNLRLWERNVNHTDFLSVRLGMGNIPSPNPVKTPKEKFVLIDDALVEEPQLLREEFKLLRNVPITFPLAERRLLGVIADSADKTAEMARSLAIQLAAYHPYTDLRLAFFYPRADAEKYGFARWLPHVWSEDGETRLLAEDANGAGEVLYCLSTVLRTRLQDNEESKKKQRALPHYVIFVADPTLIEGEAMTKYLYAPAAEMGMSVVLLYGSIGLLPNSCSALLRQDRNFSGYCSLDSAFADCDFVTFDRISPLDADYFARSLSGFRIREEQSAGAAPSMLSFLDMYRISRVEDLDIYRNWLNNRSFESMKAMIGYKNADTPLYLDIHEKYHGPHGLVAGTTGSGKSETLQTYILSLAVSFDPREVSFILIDYKGGGMAISFTGIPHVAGIITNLGGNQTNRALASINSEIKRRQAVFNEYSVKHIDEYIELFRAERAGAPMPHLLIISDEFAELKKEQPEFVRELVSAARVGRSLGVHLILATQDPSASVDDEIWSNSKFRLCLRVAGKQNSQAMLHRPDAAYITNAGRCYFQVGNDEIFELFQSGWSGAAYEPEIPYHERAQSDIRMINLWGKAAVKQKKKKAKSDGEKVTQLSAVVQYIAEVAREKQIAPVADIWLPPLPERVTLDDLSAAAPKDGGLSVPLGLADYPTGQRQFTFCLDLVAEGHLIVAGPGGSGKTTLLQTLLYGLVTRYPPERVNIYIADFNSRTLGVFASLPHCGGVVFDSDPDKIDKLMTMLARETARRVVRFSAKGIGTFREYAKIYSDVPAIVLAIDNFAAFTENNDKLQDALVQLSRQSASYGLYIVLTCTNAGDVRSRIRQNISCGIGVQMPDRFEYDEVLGAKPSFLADERVTGRGLAVCDTGGDKPDVLEVQFAVALDAPDSAALNAELRSRFTAAAAQEGGAAAAVIPQVPDDLSLDKLVAIEAIAAKSRSGRYLPLGYDVAEAEPLYADLADTYCFSVSGTARSGKTTFLKALMSFARRQEFSLYVFDGAGRELEGFAKEMRAEYMTNGNELYAFMESVLVPEIKRRNPAKGEFIDRGYGDPDGFFASAPKLCLFVHDMSAFCEAVYTSEKEMKGYFETILLPKGKYHLFYIFACLSPEDFSGEWGTKPVLRKFAAYKEGLHLGGNIDGQRIFDFEAPVLVRMQKLPPGQGHIIDGGATKRIAVMSV